MNTLNLNIDFNNIEESFKRIANELMNDWILKIEKSSYRIAEIEFYLKNEDKHNDPYVHGHKLQKEKGRWYIHASGMDLTFGDKDSFGGILIRAIYNIENEKEYYYGPINCFTEIFKSLNSIYQKSYSFGLIKDENKIIKYEEPIAARRVNLNKSINIDWHNKLYRYLIRPKEKHANKTLIVEDMERQGLNEELIKNIWK